MKKLIVLKDNKKIATDEYTSSVELSGNIVDWELGAVFTKTILGTVSLSFNNATAGKQIVLCVNGGTALTLPANVTVLTGEYHEELGNYIEIVCAKVGLSESNSIYFAKIYNYEVTVIVIHPILEGLMSVYEFNENSGTIINDLHGVNNGTSYNCVISDSGILGKCLDLNGSTSYVELPDLFTVALAEVSLSIWFLPLQVTNTRQLINGNKTGSNNYDWQIDVRNANKISVFYNNAISMPSVDNSIIQNQWNHAVFTLSANGAKLYLNGNLLTSNALPGNIGANGSNIKIGVSQLASEYFIGLIDQVAIWSKALSSDEVVYLYNSGNGLAYQNW